MEEYQNKKMNNTSSKSYTSTITVDKDVTSAFNSIKNFSAWWSEEIEGNTDKVGETFFYHYKDVHLCKIKLIEVFADKKLVYQVIDNEFNFTKDKTEWINTRIIFSIYSSDGHTRVEMTHIGLFPGVPCFDECKKGWDFFAGQSLQALISIGKGTPHPSKVSA